MLQDKWNFQYFAIKCSDKALCLVCNETIGVLKEYNIKYHCELNHLNIQEDCRLKKLKLGSAV